MNFVGERIAEERRRLGLKQEEFAEIGGCGRTTQIKIEKSEGKVDTSYLEKIGVAGADLVYIVTGNRASSESLYQDTGEALNAVLDVQGELELSFSADQIKNLLELAWRYQMSREQLKASVLSSYQFREIDLPTRKDG